MKFQPIPIDSYFLHFPDKLLDDAKVIGDGNMLKLLKRDRRKGFWLFNQAHPEALEVELLASKSKIKSFSCDCQLFQKQKQCAHVVAAIQIAITTYQQDQAQTVKHASPRHLQTKTILRNISDRDLRNFVLHFAGQHPHFALMLKAKFAHSIELEDNLGKYFGLCKRYASTLGPGALSSTKLKKLFSYVDDLLYLGDDLFAVGNYRETYHLIYGVLRFCNLRHVVHNESTLQPILITSHQKLTKLLGASIAPQLRKEILRQFLDVIENERYIIFNTQNLYTLLVQFAVKETEKSKVIVLLKKYLAANNQNNEAIFSLFEIYHGQRDYDLLVQLVIDHQDNFSIVERSLKWLEARDEMQDILNKVSEHLYHAAAGHKLKQLSFDYLIKTTKQAADRVSFCVDYFLSSRKIQSYRKIKEVLKNKSPQALHQILSILEEEHDFPLLCLVLGEEQQWKKLLLVQQQQRDLDLLLISVHQLYQHEYRETEILLLDLIGAFLQIHVGQHAFDQINRIIRLLRRGQMPKLINALYKMIDTDFKERTLLMRSLNN